MSCRSKTHNSTNIECSEQYKNSIDTFMAHEKDVSNLSIGTVKPGETFIEEWQMVGNKIMKKTGSDIYVYLLSSSFTLKDRLIKAEIVNQKQDTIFYVNNIFLFQQRGDSTWVPIRYPENYVRTSLGYSIPPQKRITLELYFPHEENAPLKGEYRLRLEFCNATRNTNYYICKNFIIDQP